MTIRRLFAPIPVSLILLVVSSHLLLAQPEYRWTVYSALNSTQAVAFDSAGTLWAATTGGVVGYSLTDNTTRIFHTRDELFPEKQGLLSLNSTAIAIDPATGDMYVGSDAGLVSIRRQSGQWGYSAEIASMTERPSRLITGFGFNQGRVYFLTAFGVGVYRSSDSSFIESYLRFGSIPQNTPVRSIAFWRGRVWVGTDNGIASADMGGANLAAPDAWTVHPAALGRSILSFAELGDSMVVGTDSGAYTVLADGTGAIRTDIPAVRVVVARAGGSVVAASEVAAYAYNGGAFSQATGVGGIVRSVAIAPNGSVGFGTRDLGVGLWRNGTLAMLRPNAPAGNYFADLALATDGTVWTANSFPSVVDAGFSSLEGEEWTAYDKLSLKSGGANSVWHVGSAPDGKVFAGTFGYGAMELQADGDSAATQVINEKNSPITGIFNSPSFVVVAKAVTDFSGRTWFLNYDPTQGLGPLLVVRLLPGETAPDGTNYREFVSPYNFARVFRWIAIDDNGTKWLGADAHSSSFGSFAGLMYLNDGGTPTNLTDDRWGLLTTADGLISNQQSALLVDKLGEVWMGASKGLSVLVNPVSVVNNDSRPIIRTIRALSDIYVHALAVDALNRKWVGTDQGLFLLSAEGDTVIAKFTAENSPLVNNQIRSILSVEATGDIYIGTSNGMNKVRTIAEAPKGDAVLAVSPHPFLIPSDDYLRIKGLPADAIVKIFTAGGTLIREFPSPGGAVALWDGLDNNGNLVPSGVYLIAASARNGDNATVGKVAVIRQ